MSTFFMPRSLDYTEWLPRSCIHVLYVNKYVSRHLFKSMLVYSLISTPCLNSMDNTRYLLLIPPAVHAATLASLSLILILWSFLCTIGPGASLRVSGQDAPVCRGVKPRRTGGPPPLQGFDHGSGVRGVHRRGRGLPPPGDSAGGPQSGRLPQEEDRRPQHRQPKKGEKRNTHLRVGQGEARSFLLCIEGGLRKRLAGG